MKHSGKFLCGSSHTLIVFKANLPFFCDESENTEVNETPKLVIELRCLRSFDFHCTLINFEYSDRNNSLKILFASI